MTGVPDFQAPSDSAANKVPVEDIDLKVDEVQLEAEVEEKMTELQNNIESEVNQPTTTEDVNNESSKRGSITHNDLPTSSYIEDSHRTSIERPNESIT